MNKTILSGRLTADPKLEEKVSDNNRYQWSHFTLAVKKNYLKQGEPDADFIMCTVFGHNASYLVKYAEKGSRINLIGRLESRSRIDENGKRTYFYKVNVNELWVLDYRQDMQSADQYPPFDPNGDDSDFSDVPDPDDVPFLNE